MVKRRKKERCRKEISLRKRGEKGRGLEGRIPTTRQYLGKFGRETAGGYGYRKDHRAREAYWGKGKRLEGGKISEEKTCGPYISWTDARSDEYMDPNRKRSSKKKRAPKKSLRKKNVRGIRNTKAFILLGISRGGGGGGGGGWGGGGGHW